MVLKVKVRFGKKVKEIINRLECKINNFLVSCVF